ncbi:hypothetical protein [Burkholderia glumae]|uniref:Uncharacterized protein n=1 Tax=Burkholderia glumae TaxID=337 RepID=A0ABY5BFF5_BURGL|nr:hypothetical protein [Burkholderia glumae]NVE23858.1 hypothetical protein [Burkholderia glumae]USS45379.1 hypothetical protein NFI99_27770 [Burkholderia glumae]UVS96701.1 hypothetical protein EFP19_13710 [Burkholderia glumae]
MILPSFEPPHFDDLTRYWRSCTYADVHLLILEVLHLRMTLRELAERCREASRVVAKSELAGGPPCPPLHRLNRQLNREVSRAGPLDDGTSPITPYSEEWCMREAVHCVLNASPTEPDPGAASARKLPEFIPVTWTELRAAWADVGRAECLSLTLEQRLVLESVRSRRNLRKFAKLARAAQEDAPDSPSAKLLRHALEQEFDSRRY